MGKNRSNKKKKSKQSNGHRDTSVAIKDHRTNYSMSLDTFGSSRKRHLETVDFVFPKDKKGNVVEYLFGNHHSNNEAKQSPINAGGNEDEKLGTNLSSLSIDDILKGKSSNKTKENLHRESTALPTVASVSSSHTQDASPSKESEQQTLAMGHLSGKSLEEVVQDKAGCRPRANSTDGELDLPQRGLCDERTVLTKHKWSSTYLKQRKSSKAVGLTNLGNTCFLNSTIQCLAFLPPFSQSLLSMPPNMQDTFHSKKENQGKRITAIISKLFQQMHGGVNGASSISPRSIVKAVPSLSACGSRHGYKFRPGRQEDAHEFLVHLLDAMNDGELRGAGINQHVRGWRDRLPVPRLDETTFVHRIFGGYLRSQVKCTDCGYCSNTYDPFLDISLEVSKKSCQTLGDAFHEYTRKEILDRENKWKCSKCNKLICAQKQLTIFRPPLSLCVQLKRFSFGGLQGFSHGRFGSGKKITRSIKFPATMDLALSDDRSCPYVLTGIVIHVGGSASSGHYTACVKNPNGDNWFHMDDSYVESVSERHVLQHTEGAYLLFYSRKEVKIEFPTPPLKVPVRSLKSMSTAEAIELAKARARSRSGSFSDMIESTNSSVPSSSKNSPAAMPIIETPKRPHLGPEVGSKTMGLAKDDDSVASSSSSSSSSSSASASSTEVKKEKVDDRKRVSEANMEIGSSSDSSDDSSGSESLDSKQNEDTGGASYPGRSIDSTQAVASPIVTPAQSLTESSTDLSATEKLPNKKTKIVLDRGPGRGKVEVMLGPRAKKKAWKPATVLRNKETDYSLLGNKSVGGWADEGADEAGNVTPVASPSKSVEENRRGIIRQIDRSDSSRKRKMFLDRWDAMLDQGKKKKVKKSPTPSPASQGGKSNAFQRIQFSVQRMSRGKAKGYARQNNQSSNKKSKKR